MSNISVSLKARSKDTKSVHSLSKRTPQNSSGLKKSSRSLFSDRAQTNQQEMSRTKDANGDDHSPSASAVAASRGGRQATGGARSKTFSSPSAEKRTGGTTQETPLQLPPIDCILLREEVEEEIDEKAKQQLIRETMETYREDFLNERRQRKLLWEEVNSLRQQVHLLLSELSTARQQMANQSDKLNRLQKQMNELIIRQEQVMEDIVDSEAEKRRRFSSASFPSSSDGFQSAWRCLICTYENPRERQACCEVCGSIRFKDNEMPKTKSDMASAGELEPDQVKTKRRKCGNPGEHQWPSTAYMQWKPKSLGYRNTLDIPGQLFGLHVLNEMNARSLGVSR